MASCGGSSHRVVKLSWAAVTPQMLGATDGSRPFVATVAAARDGQPWLAGGASFSGGSPQVALWSSPSLAGPWAQAQLHAVAGRDGPYETMLYFARGATSTVAFGSRNSPREGYPRPSTWVAGERSDLSWNETLEPRELFGGPNIVGFGGMAAGPHGYSLAGTWTGPVGRPLLAVWSSPDGRTWTRDDSDPAFKGFPGEILFGNGIADSGRGLLMVGTAEAPTPSDPLREHGAVFYSGTGERWSRLLANQIGESAPDSTFDAVSATGTGWVISGTDTVRSRTWAAMWFVTADQSLRGPIRVGHPLQAGERHTTEVVADGSRLLVAVNDGDRVDLWTASIGPSGPGTWSAVAPPPATLQGLQRVAVSASDEGTILALVATSSSQLWVARPPW